MSRTYRFIIWVFLLVVSVWLTQIPAKADGPQCCTDECNHAICTPPPPPVLPPLPPPPPPPPGKGGGGPINPPPSGDGGGKPTPTEIDLTCSPHPDYIRGWLPLPTDPTQIDYYDIHIFCPTADFDTCAWVTIRERAPEDCIRQTHWREWFPCVDVDFDGAGIQCTAGWVRTLRVTIPPVGFEYMPRGLVTVPILFAGGPVTQDFQCTPPVNGFDPQAWMANDDFRNFIFCMRWRQVGPWDQMKEGKVPALFDFLWDERPWGDPQETKANVLPVPHAYFTSSWAKPVCGYEHLPGYQVQVKTYWVLDWYTQWEQKIRRCAEYNSNGKCVAWEDVWVPGSGSGTYDLRRCGSPSSYTWSFKVQSNVSPPGDALCVPVIEVQGVIK